MKYKLLKDLPGCKAGVVSEYNGKWFLFGAFNFTNLYVKENPDFFEEVKEKWYITLGWGIINDPYPHQPLQPHNFDSKEEAEKYKRWHEPRFSLQDVEDAVLKNSANVTDEIEKLKG